MNKILIMILTVFAFHSNAIARENTRSVNLTALKCATAQEALAKAALKTGVVAVTNSQTPAAK